jgi:large subunit ribosomal protein L22
MSDETPEIEAEEPPKKKPARRRKKAGAEEAPVAASASEATASNASEADATPDAEPDSAADEPEAAPIADPVAEEEQELEAAEEDDAEPEAEAEAPAKPRRRRRGAAKEEVKAPSLPAPTRRRARRDPSLPAPVVRAEAKYVRSSARKARLVCDHIRGKSVEDARAILAHTPRAIAQDWSKLLESAVANAEHNHELVGEDLYIKAVKADEGPTIKRFRPRAMGRATKILKRTSHLTILLTPKD